MLPWPAAAGAAAAPTEVLLPTADGQPASPDELPPAAAVAAAARAVDAPTEELLLTADACPPQASPNMLPSAAAAAVAVPVAVCSAGLELDVPPRLNLNACAVSRASSMESR